jgi:uncharacterized membrane protein YdjX (TVP38/TMEM64 family)
VEAVAIFAGSFVLAAVVVRYRDHVQGILNGLGPFAMPLAVAIMAIVASAPFSVTDALAIMNGVLFGPLWGSVVNALGIIAAALIGYAVAMRTCKLLDIDRQIEKLPSWVRRYRVGSPMFLLVVRVIPGLGGTVATQTAAALRVPVWVHVWTMSAIAIPICTILAIFGDRAATFLDQHVSAPVHRYIERHHPHLPHFPHVHIQLAPHLPYPHAEVPAPPPGGGPAAP